MKNILTFRPKESKHKKTALKDALVRILTEPKNAIVKQYQKLFSMDGVELEFEEGAVVRIAEKTLERKTGARGLRAVIEEIMNDLMFNIPSEEGVKKVVITKDFVDGEAEAVIVRE